MGGHVPVSVCQLERHWFVGVAKVVKYPGKAKNSKLGPESQRWCPNDTPVSLGSTHETPTGAGANGA